MKYIVCRYPASNQMGKLGRKGFISGKNQFHVQRARPWYYCQGIESSPYEFPLLICDQVRLYEVDPHGKTVRIISSSAIYLSESREIGAFQIWDTYTHLLKGSSSSSPYRSTQTLGGVQAMTSHVGPLLPLPATSVPLPLPVTCRQQSIEW